MYTREFSPEMPTDIPNGYGGSTFSQNSDPIEHNDEPVTASAHPHRPPPPRFDPGSIFSRLSLSRLGDLNLRSLFSGDLLLIAVALLLVTSGGDGDCEDSGDLWILLLLLYFMK